jgi:hypothetical protein
MKTWREFINENDGMNAILFDKSNRQKNPEQAAAINQALMALDKVNHFFKNRETEMYHRVAQCMADLKGYL